LHPKNFVGDFIRKYKNNEYFFQINYFHNALFYYIHTFAVEISFFVMILPPFSQIAANRKSDCGHATLLFYATTTNTSSLIFI
jgi:hypothetical protein